MKNKQNIKYVGKYKRYCGQFFKSNNLKQKEQLSTYCGIYAKCINKINTQRTPGELYCCKLRCLVLLKTAKCAIVPKQP